MKKRSKSGVNKVVRKYMQVMSSTTFRWIFVYRDHTISVGCEQRLIEQHVMEVAP